MKRVVLGLFGFLLLICIPAHAGVLGGKKMIRVYESAGAWCQFPYRYVHYDNPADLSDLQAITTFTALDSTATLFFEVDNGDPENPYGYDFLENTIDNVLVAESDLFQHDWLWKQFGCFHTATSGFTSYFDFTLIPDDDPRIVFRDSFVGGPKPGWAGLWNGEASWSSHNSSQPTLPSDPDLWNGALTIGFRGAPLKASSSITMNDLVPDKNYGISFWWEASVPEGGIEMNVRVFDEPPYPLYQRQSRFGTVSDQVRWNYYYVDVPEDTPDLVIDLSGLSADADLYVLYGDPPEFGYYHCAPLAWGAQNESCSFTDPTPGRWWIGVVNWDPGPIDYTVKAEWRAPLDFYTVSPCRVLDTRGGTGAPLTSGWIDFAVIGGACGVPRSAKAVSVNLTVVQPTGNGNLKLWPANLPIPAASSINFAPGLNRANNAILNLATDGLGDLAVLPFVAGEGNVHLIIDVNGYFE